RPVVNGLPEGGDGIGILRLILGFRNTPAALDKLNLIDNAHGRFDSSARYFAHSLHRVGISYREQAALNHNGKISGGSLHQVGIIHIATIGARWNSGQQGSGSRSHAQNARKGLERNARLVIKGPGLLILATLEG